MRRNMGKPGKAIVQLVLTIHNCIDFVKHYVRMKAAAALWRAVRDSDKKDKHFNGYKPEYLNTIGASDRTFGVVNEATSIIMLNT